MTLTGHLVSGSGGAVTYAAYYDNSDTLFGTASLLGSSGSLSSPFFFQSLGIANLDSPFSLTEVITVTPHGRETFSLDASIASVPEAPTWAMMGFGFAALGYAAFRGRKNAVAAVA